MRRKRAAGWGGFRPGVAAAHVVAEQPAQRGQHGRVGADAVEGVGGEQQVGGLRAAGLPLPTLRPGVHVLGAIGVDGGVEQGELGGGEGVGELNEASLGELRDAAPQHLLVRLTDRHLGWVATESGAGASK